MGYTLLGRIHASDIATCISDNYMYIKTRSVFCYVVMFTSVFMLFHYVLLFTLVT